MSEYLSGLGMREYNAAMKALQTAVTRKKKGDFKIGQFMTDSVNIGAPSREEDLSGTPTTPAAPTQFARNRSERRSRSATKRIDYVW
ncbi:hypothetical protein L917_17495 [Phytophthora nicotianae]|uniref:Uncharacterized protein n=4 Tax=Phytophthora nicotianae TaxID=4792 RepID=W2PLU1_PHYN3|nr:hypothetical protein PPTG_24006 [Phytophthora nicotianae INRA-310]ETL82331.1 hypothetical protein L917_17495 [Phytophthora nicotianae]ETN01802.1 hypothetical protein PPTG_24006 [Phytophthora nicotianae INRA-310]